MPTQEGQQQQSGRASAPPSRTPLGSPPRRRPWSIEDLREIVAAVTDGPSLLRETDRRGLAPVQYAALQAATATDSLLPLLSLLEPKESETSQLDLVIKLLESIAESQIRIERRVVEIESRLAGRPSASQQPSKPAAAASRS